MTTVLLFIILLGVLVLVHELGHFYAAKKSGCNVEEFGIGFPPRLWTIKKGETKYCINLLPLGGYVKIKGENGEASDDPRSFVNKSFAWKSFIISAGVLMNILLGYVLISIGLIIGVPTIIDDGADYGKFAQIEDKNIQVVQVLQESPAFDSDVKPGDILLSLNGNTIETTDDLSEAISENPDADVNLSVMRGDEELNISVTPTELDGYDYKGIGIAMAETGVLSYPWYIAIFEGFIKTFQVLWLIITGFAALIGQLFSGADTSAQLAGPIGIAVMTGDIAKLGFVYFLQFAAMLSLNLAILNIVPFPALDGGRLALIIFEKIRGKKVKIHIENWFHTIGFVLLMILIVVVTAQDIRTYGASIWQSILNIFQ